VLLVYDTLLALEREKDLVWNRKAHIGSILYFVARYGNIGLFLSAIPITFWPDQIGEMVRLSYGIMHCIN
jgi:hypothetical protein